MIAAYSSVAAAVRLDEGGTPRRSKAAYMSDDITTLVAPVWLRRNGGEAA
jgi:hypothetical protein